MGQMIEQLQKIIASRDVGSKVSNDGENIKISCSGQHGEWDCIISVSDEAETIQVLSIIPVVVPQHRRRAVAEFITLVNWDLVGGRFELNFETGRLCCECDRFVGDTGIDEYSFLWMIDITYNATDLFLPGLLRVIGSDIPSHGWLKRVRHSMASLIPVYNTDRMVVDYTKKYYLKKK